MARQLHLTMLCFIVFGCGEGANGAMPASGGATGVGGTSGSGGSENDGSVPGELDANAPPFACDASTGVPFSGAPDTWNQLSLPGLVAGDRCQSVVVDPVNPNIIITACGANDGRKIKWYRSSDYGETWAITNNTSMGGNPWGFSIDPNPRRNPCVAPTLYSPAGYGSFGAWKSTDGAATWTRLAGADAAFGSYNPFGANLTDLYHVALLPDDPPNHVLATYHYTFKDVADGGFGETWDGGQTWVIHPPPAGIGTSHYVIPISGTTWCVIAQTNDGTNGMWRTTTAGRMGGTAANSYRDGTISTSAWTRVSTQEHPHGSYTAVKVGTAWYSAAASSIWKSVDEGATWTDLVPGSYWASPPNPKFLNKNVSGLAATARYIYSNYFLGPEIARAPVNDDTNWQRDYVATPPLLKGLGAEPFANATALDAVSGKWLVFMGTNNGMWRYIEP